MTAAVMAAQNVELIKYGVTVAFTWGPEDPPDPKSKKSKTSLGHGYWLYAWLDPKSGYIYPLYNALQMFHKYFPKGTTILPTFNSSPDIVSILASPQYTILVNKAPIAVSVRYNNQLFQLQKWQVEVIPTPPNSH
jgi:hypothetical protein